MLRGNTRPLEPVKLGSPAIGRAPKDLAIPEGCSLFAVIRDGIATPLRPDTIMLEGDKIIAIGKQECQDLLHDQLIGDPALKSYHLLPGVRGDLLHRLGRYDEARAAFEAAAQLAGNRREQELMKRRAAEAAKAATS